MTQPDTDETTEASALYKRDGDRDERSYATFHIRDDESVTEAIVRAVGNETRTGRMELPPLYSAIDPEALEALFTGPDGNVRRSNGSVTFEYCGRQVLVQANDIVQIGPSLDA